MKTPYPYQEEAIQKALESTGLIVADECGLGKTIVAIETAKRSRGDTTSWRCLIMCPPALIPQWIDEIEEQDPGQPVYVVNRQPVAFGSLTGYFVMSIYDLTASYVREALGTVLFDLMIIDEAHRIKNRQTKTAKYAKAVPAARRIALTGTPMEKTPADLWSLLNWVSPDDFKVYWSFVHKNLEVEAGYWERYIIGGPKDPIKFGELLAPHVVRRTKEEVVTDLPERLTFEVRVDMTPKQKDLYNRVKQSKDILVHIDEDKDLLVLNVLSQITKLQQISSWPRLLDDGFTDESGKLDWLWTFIEDHPDDRMVIFTRFRDLAWDLSQRLESDVVIGGLRKQTPDPKYVVGTIDAMGEGLNFQWAKHAIFLDSHWSNTKMSQAIDRIHRVNITEPKNIYFLHSCREDRLILHAMEKKMTQSELVYYYLNEAD